MTRLEAARRILLRLANRFDARFSVRLWDGSTVALGRDVDPGLVIQISGPGVLGSLLRRPTLRNLLEHYAGGGIDLCEGTVLALIESGRGGAPKLGPFTGLGFLKDVVPLWLTPRDSGSAGSRHQFARDEIGRRRSREQDRDFIQFHYDLGNEFFALFLDPELQYSCAYFPNSESSLEQAQRAKLTAICQKLRLQPGERLLDVGCGWGGLVCHAASEYGVRAHGITLSQEQYDYSKTKIQKLGLENQVTVALRDYTALDGEYDKIASIEMYEHVGIRNHPTYFKKLRSLLSGRGLVLVQGTTRRARKSARRFRRIRPERQLLLEYVFPGSEPDHIGRTVQSMEAQGLEVLELESWRHHYARTTRFWCERLYANRETAERLVGPERTRTWIAYLAGVHLAFSRGSLRVYQTLASRRIPTSN